VNVAKFEVSIAKFEVSIADCEVSIADCEVATPSLFHRFEAAAAEKDRCQFQRNRGID
jgi:hypothetical protein